MCWFLRSRTCCAERPTHHDRRRCARFDHETAASKGGCRPHSASRDDSTSYAAATNAQGAFILENIEPGTYYLSGDKLGYLTGRYGAGQTSGLGVELRFSPGQRLRNVQLFLTPQAVISGHVVDEDGDPDGHCSVSIFTYVWRHAKRERQFRESGSIDDEAGFRFAGLPPGKYYISAQPYNFLEGSIRSREQTSTQGEVTTYYPDTVNPDFAVPISVTPGQRISNLKLKIQKGSVHTITGKVVGLETLPEPEEFSPERAYVSLRRASTSSGSDFSNNASVNKNGSFEIGGVQPGAYDLIVGQGRGATVSQAKVEIADRDLENLILQVAPPQSVSGRIRIEGNKEVPLSGINLALQSEDGEFQVMPARLKPDGSFVFSTVGLGKYRVSIWRKPEGTYLKSVRFGGGESADEMIDVTAGSSEPLDLVLGRMEHRLWAP